jgi:hypothetical protein
MVTREFRVTKAELIWKVWLAWMTESNRVRRIWMFWVEIRSDDMTAETGMLAVAPDEQDVMS